LWRHRFLLAELREQLLREGLIVVGHIAGGSDERVEPWNLSLDDTINRIYDDYVVHHDDRNWVFRAWFQLTESGEQRVDVAELQIAMACHITQSRP